MTDSSTRRSTKQMKRSRQRLTTLTAATVLVALSLTPVHGFVSQSHPPFTAFSRNLALGSSVALPHDGMKNPPGENHAPLKKKLMKSWRSHKAAAQKKRQQTPVEQEQLVQSVRKIVRKSKNQAATKLSRQQQSTIRSLPQQEDVPAPRRSSSWRELGPGSLVSGRVVKVLPYGALIKMDHHDLMPGRAKTAMLHKSQIMLDEKISSVAQVLRRGKRIHNARVVSLNRQLGRVALSLRSSATNTKNSKLNQSKKPRAPPAKLATLTVGDEVEGKIVAIKAYGAFVDVGYARNKNALLHISRMSPYKVENIEDVVHVGQTVRVRVTRVDDVNIAVSMLTPEHDAFRDRREKQRERDALWFQLVYAEKDEQLMEELKAKVLELDNELREEYEAGMDAPRRLEL